jgi:Protein of unknown function (DUF3551)
MKLERRRTTVRRLLLIGLSAALCALATDSAHAERYCLQGQHYGYPGNCHFSTYHQCVASASGTNASCGINPRYAHQRHRGQGH